jgi:hypothetical protein
VFTSRVFELPLFDAGAPTSFRLFLTQALAGKGSVTVFYSDGFPNTYEEWGIQLDRLAWGEGEVDLAVGDFLYSALRPDDVIVRARDQYRLRGGRFDYRVGATSLRLFVGDPRFFRQLPDQTVEEPGLAGLEFMRRTGLWTWSAGLTLVADATLLDGPETEDLGVVAVRAHRSFWDDGTAFADLELTDDGALGGRAGAQLRAPVGVITGYIYGYDDGFPWLYPVYRPGERGIDLSGTYRASASTTLYGRLNWLEDSAVDPRDEIQGYVGTSWFLGDNRPSLMLEFSRNDLATDVESIAPRDRTSDRLVVGVNGSTMTSFLSARLEQVWESGTGARDRTQLTAFWRRGLRFERFIDMSAVVQREQDGDLGVTVDGFVERPVRGYWNLIAGLGVAYQHLGSEDLGEGVLRLGVARRMVGNGLSLRVEGIVPFSIGLERADLRREQVSVDVSYVLDWRRVEDIRAAWAPLLAPRSFGFIEGRVTLNGDPVDGVRVLLDGAYGATTGADGRFRVRRVPVGPVALGIDLGQLSPRVSVVGNPTQVIDVRSVGGLPVEIHLEETSLLQGAVVRCTPDGDLAPVQGARLIVTNDNEVREGTTSHLGAFQFDRLPPGEYELTLDPSSVEPPLAPDDGARWTLDLTDADVTGFVIRVGCGDDGRTIGGRAR